MLAWLGGSFNPIHQGHIQLAIEAKSLLPVKQINLLPCRQQALKRKISIVDNEKRLVGLNRAIKTHPFLNLDDTELKSKQPVNYTSDTLKVFSKAYPHHTLIFIMGSDSLEHLHQWKDWQGLLRYSNLLIFNRIYDNSQKIVEPKHEVRIWLKKHLTSLPNLLSLDKTAPPLCGKILCLNMQKPVPISSAQLRQTLSTT